MGPDFWVSSVFVCLMVNLVFFLSRAVKAVLGTVRKNYTLSSSGLSLKQQPLSVLLVGSEWFIPMCLLQGLPAGSGEGDGEEVSLFWKLQGSSIKSFPRRSLNI